MRGGGNEERLYLYDMIDMGVKKTDMPQMADLIARHKSRYHLAAFLARPGMKVLDFPCGSGYGSELLFDVDYHGMDLDNVTIEYAQKVYRGNFYADDMKAPKKMTSGYDLILCIEGLEHIEEAYQQPLIERFYSALNPGGRLLVSMPEAKEKSGPNPLNVYHVWELTFDDFYGMLEEVFSGGVQMITHEDILHNGQKATCMYGICQKGDE